MKKITKSLMLFGVFIAFTFFVAGAGGSYASELERDFIKIGVVGALKRPYGMASLRGAEMAAKEINDAGGVLGAKIELFSADSEATAPKATEAIEKLYYSDKVDAIVGAYSAEEASAFQEESAKLKINMLFHGSTSILDYKYRDEPEKYKYYWNYSTASTHFPQYIRDYQLDLFIDAFKREMGLDTVNVAVITDVALWAKNVHTWYIDLIKTRPDMKLVYEGKIARDAVDFTAEMTALREKNVQLIIVGMGFSAGYTFIKQVYDLQLPVMLIGLNALTFATDNFIKSVGIDAAAYNSSLAVNAMPTTPKTAELLGEYEKVYGGKPHADVGFTYNGVKAYAKAVEMAGSLDQDKVQKALEKVRLPENEAWNAKAFWFDDTHRVHVAPEDGLILYTFQISPTGEIGILHPEEIKTADVLIPHWMVERWKKK